MTIRFAVVFFIFAISSAFADVKGQFKVDGATVITPQNAAAYPVRDQQNPRAWQVEVALAEGAVDTNAIIEALDPHVDVINQEGVRSGNYILLWVGTDGRVSMNATLSETMSQFIETTEQGNLKAELTTNTKERVAGRVFTANPVKTLDGKVYELDVTFDTAVSRGPDGTKLPANGGDAGQAFNNLYQAIQKKDEKGIRAGVSPRVEKMLFADYNTAEENLKSAVEILTAWFPKKNVKVTGGEMRGEAALLEVEGDIYEGRNALYIAKMEKGTGGWQLEQIVPAGMFPK